MLPKGEYLGSLYDIGFDRPETHVIKKEDTLFYSFYADSFKGEIELRGLDNSKKYLILDYIKNISLGQIQNAKPILKIEFRNFLLIKVSQIK
jgi:alpha-galactosidase